MIDNARIGDDLAMVNDAQLRVDVPAHLAPVEALEEVPPVAEEASATKEEEGAPAEESTSAAEAEAGSEGAEAASRGQSRGSNPYDGRTAKGKAWYRGFDAAVTGRE
jgi:hypothetical protein